MSLTRVVSPATSCPVKIPVAAFRLPLSFAPLTSKSVAYSELTNSHPLSSTTAARASGVGAALGSDATGDEAAATGEEIAAGDGSPQARAISDTQRARASDRLRLAEIIPPVHEKSDGRALVFDAPTCFAYQVMGIAEGLRAKSIARADAAKMQRDACAAQRDMVEMQRKGASGLRRIRLWR